MSEALLVTTRKEYRLAFRRILVSDGVQEQSAPALATATAVSLLIITVWRLLSLHVTASRSRFSARSRLLPLG